jgi:serine/threonine-protein kinase HipA
MERQTEVLIDLDGNARLVGRLWSRSIKGRESASFEFDAAWVDSKLGFPLEPLQTIDAGVHNSHTGKPLFGAIGDSFSI